MEPFLGRGLDGYVFRVNHRRGKEVALKVSLKSLSEEFAILVGAFSLIPDLVVMPLDEAKECVLDDGNVCGGYLMGEIGAKVDLGKRTSCVDLLSQLHQNGFVHGDPRLPNILFVENKHKFIDFRKLGHGVTVNSLAKENDLKILIKSAYLSELTEKQCQTIFSQQNVRDHLKTYGANSTSTNARSVVKDVISY